MGVDLPGVAHAAVDLHRGLGAERGGFVGDEFGGRCGAHHVAGVGLVVVDPSGVHRRFGHLGVGQHLCAHVFHRLEGPDGFAELLALFGIGQAEFHGTNRKAHLLGGGEDGAAQAPVGGGCGIAQWRSREFGVDPPHRVQKVQRLIELVAAQIGGVDHHKAVVGPQHQLVETTEVVDYLR